MIVWEVAFPPFVSTLALVVSHYETAFHNMKYVILLYRIFLLCQVDFGFLSATSTILPNFPSLFCTYWRIIFHNFRQKKQSPYPADKGSVFLIFSFLYFISPPPASPRLYLLRIDNISVSSFEIRLHIFIDLFYDTRSRFRRRPSHMRRDQQLIAVLDPAEQIV